MAPRRTAISQPPVGGAKGQQGEPVPSQGEQEVNQRPEGSQTGSQQVPPVPVIDLVQVMHNQTLLLETLANNVLRPRPHGHGMNEKLTDFLRTKPPTFGGSANPLEEDDWLRVIQRKLEPFDCEDRDKVLLASHQLTGTALAWWENYCSAAQDATTITWREFVEEFRRYHIPAATMKRKAEEFHELQQGNRTVEDYTYHFMELARYAPEEVNSDMKKQDMFKKGLTPELRTLLTPQIYPDFNTLMNMAILTERAKAEERKDNKRKFLENKARQQDRFQKAKTFNHPPPRSQAPMQYRTQTQASGSQVTNTQYKTQENTKALQNSTGQVATAARACFNCRQTGHFIANCPYNNNNAKPAASAYSNSVNGPRPALSGANHVPVRNTTTTNNQQARQPQQSFGRARINHINAQEAQGAQGVVIGEFLVSSTLATVLFDSGASHSFISSSFVERHNMPTVLLKLPLLTRTPGVDIKCRLGCPRVKIILSGVEFLADLVVLKSKGIDVILGMDWLTLHDGLIGCAARVVYLTSPDGVRVTLIELKCPIFR